MKAIVGVYPFLQKDEKEVCLSRIRQRPCDQGNILTSRTHMECNEEATRPDVTYSV
jgi:hypothetical protein